MPTSRHGEVVLRRLRPYRMARVALALARAVPRYWLLFARDWLGLARPRGADWYRAHEIAAEQIRTLALALEGAFVKVAQIGGARSDILPKPFIEKLSRFHDSVPPRPLSELVPTLEAEWGRPFGEVVAHMEPEPIGAASLAQVHRARLRSGEDVVVKIQYPEAPRLFPMDLKVARVVARLVRGMAGGIDLPSIADEITRNVELELDFRREVASMNRLREILSDDDRVRIPRVYPDLCRKRVIVMEFLDGIQISRVDDLLEAGHVASAVSRKVGGLYGAMLFEHGFFHGDPHPGNLLVLGDGTIGLLDFGLCKELPAGFARLVARMIVSALIGDGEDSLRAAGELGFDIDTVEPDHLRTLVLRIIGDASDDEDLSELIGGTKIRRIPDDFGLVLRTMILLNGLSHRLAPGRRLVQEELLKHLAAGAQAAA